MLDKLRSHLRKEKGFTLIELLVVIAIIAILVLIVVVVINPAQRIRDANNAAATSDVRAVASGVGACITGVLGGRVSGVTDPYDVTACADDGDTASDFLISNGYLQNMPNGIEMSTSGTNICVSKEGGSADFARWDSSTGTTQPAPDGSDCVP